VAKSKGSKVEKEVRPSEVERIEDWRRQEFRRILGSQTPDDDITTLVHSDADLQQARNLAEDGCPPDLIVQILSPL
jgi:hypothetical protein